MTGTDKSNSSKGVN